MTRIFVSALACAMLACGGGDVTDPDLADNDFEAQVDDDADADSDDDEVDNQAPLVDQVRIVPANPKSGDVLKVTMKTIDPDGDSIDIEVDWYKNGQLAQSGSSLRYEDKTLRRGDQVYAEVAVSDDWDEVYEETDVVMFENQSPTVRNARLVPDRPSRGDTLLVEADAFDPDGDNFEFEYTWYVNEQERPEFDGASVKPGRLKRGDRVQVAVTATDGGGQSALFRTPPVELGNSKPAITSTPSEGSVSGGRYSYQLAAEDPDGDQPLRYSLVQGPDGLDVDLVSGLVSWDVPADAGGKFPVVVSVADAHGGENEQSYTLELNWGPPAASSGETGEADGSAEDASEAR